LDGANFTAIAEVRIGAQNATSVVSAGATQLQATSPSAVSPGAANVFAYFSNGWIAAAADAFSYGPQVLQILPNAGSNTGGETVRIYGYGFGSDATKISVKFGTGAAVVESVQNVAGISEVLGVGCFVSLFVGVRDGQDSGWHRRQSRSGHFCTIWCSHRSEELSVLAEPAIFREARPVQIHRVRSKAPAHLFEQHRSRGRFRFSVATIYCAVESPRRTSTQCWPSRTSVAPDGSQLVVADFGAQSVYLLNPDNGSGTTVPVGGVAGFLNSGPARVAATSAQTVFVGLTGEGSQGACSSCLGQLNLAVNPPVLQAATQPEVTSITGAPLLQANAAGDHVFVSFGASLGSPLALWQASSPNQFTIANANSSATDIAASADRTMFATQSSGATQIRAADLSLMSVPATPELAGSPGGMPCPA